MTKDELHHPVTNGKTKLMVLLSIIFIFTTTMTSLIFMFTASFHLTGTAFWVMKSSFGGIALTGLGALVGVTQKFFDTRTSEIKAHDKLNLKKEQHNYKIEKIKLKNEMKKDSL